MNKKVNNSYWMKICDAVASASTCRVDIGCILVKDKTIVGMGYVGSVCGDKHCTIEPTPPVNILHANVHDCLLVNNFNIKGSGDSGESCIRTIHAETNAILKCTVRGDKQNGWITCYSTYMPCLECFKLLLQIGVRSFYYRKEYKDLYRETYITYLHKNISKDLCIEKVY